MGHCGDSTEGLRDILGGIEREKIVLGDTIPPGRTGRALWCPSSSMLQHDLSQCALKGKMANCTSRWDPARSPITGNGSQGAMGCSRSLTVGNPLLRAPCEGTFY